MNILPISKNIGAIITGVNLEKELNEEMSEQIRALLVKHQVIFFRNQPEVDAKGFYTLVKKIWQPMSHPFISGNKPIVAGISPFQPYPDYPEISGIYHNRENKGNLNEWHSDLNWLSNPSFGSALVAKVIPKIGGDTLFASMTAAYDDLEQSLKEKLEDLTAYHDFMRIYDGIFESNPEGKKMMRKRYPKQAHSVAYKHPISGRKSIFVNRVSTEKIVELSEKESKELLEELYGKAKIPEYQVRYSWKPNDIAFWDNLATQHYAVSDYWPFERKMERISLTGIQL